MTGPCPSRGLGTSRELLERHLALWFDVEEPVLAFLDSSLALGVSGIFKGGSWLVGLNLPLLDFFPLVPKTPFSLDDFEDNAIMEKKA